MPMLTRRREQEDELKRIDAKDHFASNIDKHYEELTRYVSQGDMVAVLKKVEEFRKQGKMDFKNVQGIYAGARERQLKDELKRIDAKDHKSIYRIYMELASLYPKDYKEEADKLEKQEALLEKQEARKKQIEEYFDPWDGSHITLTEVIKEAMNDPDSYKHVETVYSDKGDHLIVKTTFRGKNVFGGVVPNWVVAKVDLEGNILEIIERGGPYWRHSPKPRRLRRPSDPKILLEY